MKNVFGIMLLAGIIFLTYGENNIKGSIEEIQESRIDTFTFSSDGTDINGKIYLPDSFDKEKNLPSIYLIDFTEQHFKVAKDEFEKAISAAEALENTDAVVITLEEHLDVDATPGDFQKYYDIYKNMTSYVDSNYTNNTARTFIGRGSESGFVLMALFLEDPESSVFDNFIATDPSTNFNQYVRWIINGENFPHNKGNKKLHFSFSNSNNRSECNKLIDLINQAEYPWLQFESKEYTQSNYENTYPEAFAEGIKYIFSDFTTGMRDNSITIPIGYQLEQNYPNPFNPLTVIKYDLLKSSDVELKIYDVLGREVIILVNEYQERGRRTAIWNGVDKFNSKVSSGIYFYRILAGEWTDVKKMMLVK